MDTHAPSHPAPNAAKGYISLPPEIDDDPEPLFSVKFVIFAVLVIGAAAIGGAVQSGKISLNQYFNTPKAAMFVSAGVTPAAHAGPGAGAKTAPTPVPAPPLKPDAFVVTSISIGQPSFAIINGTSRLQGDPVDAPGVTGWKVRQILDDSVILQNGSTLATLPLSAPGIKPLDDQLHPLN